MHPPFLPVPPTTRRRAAVLWYRRKDGHALGQEFYDATPQCRSSLTAKVKQLEQDGEPSTYVGHQLHPPHERIFQFFLKSYRFWAFRSRQWWFITNGNIKDDKHQEPDYRLADDCREEFFNDPDTKDFR